MSKGPILQEIWDSLPKKRRKEIESRAAKKIESYRNLQSLRNAAGLTQAKVSEELNMSQSNVSRLEKSSDMLLSTLQRYVEAIGGKLNLTVELPNKLTIALSGLSDLIEQNHSDNDQDDLELIHGRGNVYRDLGERDADVRQAKALLAAEIIKALDAEKLSTRQAEARTGINHSEFSRIRRANLDRFTIDRLISILAQLNQEVKLSITTQPKVDSASVEL